MSKITGLDNLYINKVKDHYVCFNTSENSKIALINKQTKRLLDKIKQIGNYNLFEKEEKDAIKKLVNSLLLSKDGTVKQVNNSGYSTFFVWLQLTEKCNLNCPYCSIPGKKTGGFNIFMFRKNMEEIYHHALSLGYNRIRIMIAGGEPLLEYSTLKSIIAICRKLDADVFEYLIITNGTILNKKILELLITHNIDVNISLDGTGEYHDRTRAFKNGKPSFETVNEHIDTLKENNINLLISSVINKENLANVNDLFDFLYGKDLIFRFNLVRIIYKSKSQIERDNKEFIDAFKRLFSHIKKNMPDKLISRFFMIGNAIFNHGCRKHYHCGILKNFIACHNNGDYYSCLEGITDKRFKVNLVGSRQVLPYCGNSTAKNLGFDLIDRCVDCAWKYVCRGGCPVIKYKISKRFDTPSERCSFYKVIMPEYVDLIGHQIYHLHKIQM
jgi:uncharacterized protein